jgi:hypothetical protein
LPAHRPAWWNIPARRTAIEFQALDKAALLDGMAEAAGDEATYSRVFIANPAQLYRFGSQPEYLPTAPE